jgi:ribosome-binding ATPase YchF (GTP1/OBG family)
MYIANVDETVSATIRCSTRWRRIAAKEGAMVVPICASIEAEIAELSDDDKSARSSPRWASRSRASTA